MQNDPNSAQLKHQINSGRTKDKSPGFDPAAAPLGTDDEAGGAAPSVAEIKQAIENETRNIPSPSTRGVSPSAAPVGSKQRPFPVMFLAAGLAVVLGLVFLLSAVGRP